MFTLSPATIWSVQVAPNGSANYTIPIKTMQGVNKLQPNLSINYNSNAPNGMLGVGFQLQGLPVITRVNNGRGINYDAHDTFAGSDGRLVLVDPANRIYHSENTDWIEYIPYINATTKWWGSGGCGNGPCFWKAYTTDGKILEFGKDNGRILKVGSTAVRVWSVSKVEDIYGNYYTVSYHIDAVNGDYYPDTISQPLKTSSGSFGKTHKIKFFYQGRTDVTESYAQSAMAKEDHRIHKIQVLSGSVFFPYIIPIDIDRVVREYNITYDYSRSTNRSQITSIQECGSNSATCLPVQRFNWENFPLRFTLPRWAFSHKMADHGGFDLDNYSTIRNPDINGDGRSDVCWRHDTGYFCAMSNGNGTFTYPKRAFKYNIENHSYFDEDNWSTIRNPDINGDGKSDVCWRHDTGYFCAMSNGNGTFTRPELAFSDYIANHSYFDEDNWSTIRNPDINGDGRSDVCWRYDTGYYCAMSNEGWHFYLSHVGL